MNDPTSNTAESRAKRLVKNLAALAIGCTITLAIGEAAVRLLDLPPKPLPPLNAQTYQLSSNPIIRYELRPGYTPDMDAYGPGMEGFRINAAGFRDREFETRKPPGVTRIITLGDSITAGHGVSDVDRIYPKRLETLLNENDRDRKQQVYNLGVGGYNTLQQVETLRVKGMAYDPDVVLIGFCVNDFSWEASPFVRLMEQLDPEQRELLGEMQWENRAWVNALMSRSRLAMFTFARLQSLRGERERTYNIDDYSVRGTDPVSMALPILSDLQKEHGFDCYIFIIPAFDDEYNRYGYGHIHQRLVKTVAPHSNIRVVDLFTDFAGSGKHPSALAWDGLHPTATGHDLLARYIQRYLGAPSLAQTAPVAMKRSIVKNGSFEVFNETSAEPASWYSAPPEYAPAVRKDPAAIDGNHAIELQSVDDTWTIFAHYLDLEPEDFGKTLVVSAYAKAPAARNLFLEIEWRVGEERVIERASWPASPSAYTRLEVRATIPPEAKGAKNRVKIVLRPESGPGYFVDQCEARIE